MYDVCIVGGGQSGLTTAKTFAEAGWSVVVLEKSENANGMFYEICQKDDFTWSSSKYVSSFSDFPMGDDMPTWFTIRQYIGYLEAYKERFGIDRWVHYGCEVRNCVPGASGGWTVHYVRNGSPQALQAAKLVVCSGLNQVPKYPDLQGFGGQVIHTSEVYRDMCEADWARTFTGKRILLMGGGESALDIGHLLTRYTDQLYYTTKDYIEWFPQGQDSPENLNRVERVNKPFFSKKHFASINYPTDTQLFGIEYSLPEPMSYLWHEYGRQFLYGVVNVENEPEYIQCSHKHTPLCNINETPDNLFLKYVVKRTEFILDLHEGKAQVLPYPVGFQGRSASLPEGRLDDIDIVVCATGFQKTFSFLPVDLVEGPLIKKMVSVKRRDLAFIGFARPTMGSIATIAEIQSWWVERFFADQLHYQIRRPVVRYYDPLDLANDHVNTVVIGCYYMKDLAKDMNLEPNMWALALTDWTLFWRILTGTCHPILYRLRGAKAFSGARKVLLNMYHEPDKRSPYLMWYLCMFFFFHFVYVAVLAALVYLVYWLITRQLRPKQRTGLPTLFALVFLLALVLSYVG